MLAPVSAGIASMQFTQQVVSQSFRFEETRDLELRLVEVDSARMRVLLATVTRVEQEVPNRGRVSLRRCVVAGHSR